MPDVSVDALDAGGGDDAAYQEIVERESAEPQVFVAGLSGDETKSGGWFTKLRPGPGIDGPSRARFHTHTHSPSRQIPALARSDEQEVGR